MQGGEARVGGEQLARGGQTGVTCCGECRSGAAGPAAWNMLAICATLVEGTTEFRIPAQLF